MTARPYRVVPGQRLEVLVENEDGGRALLTGTLRLVDHHAANQAERIVVTGARARALPARNGRTDMASRKDPDALRAALTALAVRRRAAESERELTMDETTRLAREAIAAGLDKVEIHRLTGLSRPTINRLLGEAS